MITTEMVYWIIMLDKISSAFFIFAAAFGLILFLMTGTILSYETNGYYLLIAQGSKQRKNTKNWREDARYWR